MDPHCGEVARWDADRQLAGVSSFKNLVRMELIGWGDWDIEQLMWRVENGQC